MMSGKLMEAAHFGITPSTTPCIFYGHYHILECKHWVHTSTLTYCAENCVEPYPTSGPLERSRPFLCEACLSEQLESWPDIARVKAKAEQVRVQLAIPLKNRHQLQEELHGLWQAYHFLKKMNFEHIKRHTGNRAYETLCDQFSPDDWLEYDFARRDFENDVAAAAMASSEGSKDKKKVVEDKRELGIPGLTEPPPSSLPRVPQPAWRDRSRSPGGMSDDERSRRGRRRDRSPRRRMHDRDAVDPAANPKYRRRSISPLRADVMEIFGQLTVDPNAGTDRTVSKEVRAGEPNPKVDCECGKDIKEPIIICHNKWCRKRFHYKSCAGLLRKPKGRWHCGDCRGLKDICYCRGRKPASEPTMRCQSIECKSKSRLSHFSCVKGTVNQAQRHGEAVWSCPACWEDSCAKAEHEHYCICKLCMAGALMVECENAKKSCDACDRYDDDCPNCQSRNSQTGCGECDRYDDDCAGCRSSKCVVGWYHITCIGMKEDEVPGEDEKWTCGKCIEKKKRKVAEAKKAVKDEQKRKEVEQAAKRRSERENKGKAPARLGFDVDGLAEGLQKLFK